MASKPKKSWTEIQLAITAIALTATLGFWNFFSAGQKPPVNENVTATDLPPTEELPQAPNPTPKPGVLPIKIIFGGKAPEQRVVVQVNAAPAQTKRKNNKNSGAAAPQPPVSTGSSKP